MSNKAQVIHKLGSPRAMKWEDWPIPNPGPGEVRLKHTAIGVNFAAEDIETYWSSRTVASVATSASMHAYGVLNINAKIVVTSSLAVIGIPENNGILPKINGGGKNRFFKISPQLNELITFHFLRSSLEI